jgi:hypothetical protein
VNSLFIMIATHIHLAYGSSFDLVSSGTLFLFKLDYGENVYKYSIASIYIHRILIIFMEYFMLHCPCIRNLRWIFSGTGYVTGDRMFIAIFLSTIQHGCFDLFAASEPFVSWSSLQCGDICLFWRKTGNRNMHPHDAVCCNASKYEIRSDNLYWYAYGIALH